MKPDIRPDTGYKKGRISGTTQIFSKADKAKFYVIPPDPDSEITRLVFTADQL